jgi:hypothetical protein
LTNKLNLLKITMEPEKINKKCGFMQRLCIDKDFGIS